MGKPKNPQGSWKSLLKRVGRSQATIDGKIFHVVGRHVNKIDAKKDAKKLREDSRGDIYVRVKRYAGVGHASIWFVLRRAKK